MTQRRQPTGLSGVLLVDKPAGMTSHDVVARVRRATGERRVGHAGTLDPGATGLLVVLVGPATRLARFLTAADKTYLASIAFGSATDTLDADGAVTDTAPVPPDVLDESFARAILARFTGTSLQTPPAYSAVKRDGVTAHRAARAGETLDLQARPITVSETTLLAVRPDAPPSWEVRFTVSKGTYIRSLAKDIGIAAGTVAHLSALRRLAAGAATIDHAIALDQVMTDGGALAVHFADPVPLLGMPVFDVDASAVTDGRSLGVPDELSALPDGSLVALADASTLHAIYRIESRALRPDAVLAGGVTR